MPKGINTEAAKALLLGETRTAVFPIDNLEWRESGSGDGSRILTGYAAVYEQETILYKGTNWTYKEVIVSGAFNNVLMTNPDVHLNLGHDMSRAIARTGINGIGGLKLVSDAHGLRVYAKLNPEDPDVCALGAKMDLGIIDQMSFAFQLKPTGYKIETVADETGHETDTRIITEIAELYDVSVCAQGAYSQTEAALRSLSRDIELLGEGAHATNREVQSSTVGAEVSNPLVERRLLALQARAKVAALTFKTRKDTQ